jgi:PAS domain S-box-containing protein
MLPENENERLKALKNYEILDTETEKEFDRITKIASIICDTPIALISLIDENRQWFKSKVGLNVDETPRCISFCQFAIMGEECFEIEDALEDIRFKENPLVTGYPSIRFYAGHPLTNDDGYNLGTLCVISPVPTKLNDNQKEALKLLAEEVVFNIENRKKNSEAKKLAKLFDLSLDLMCVADTNGHFLEVNKTWGEVLGYTIEELRGKLFLDFVHPDDLQATLDQMSLLEKQNVVLNFKNRYRVKDGSYRLIEWKATPQGTLIYAIARDVTEQEANKLELYRVNNILKEAEKITKMGAWELDLSSNKTYWSDEVYAIHEVEKGFEHNGENGIDFYHPDYRQIIIDAITKSITEQVSFDEKCKFITAKGNHRWVRSTGHPIIENDTVSKLFGVFIDITDEQEKIIEAEKEKQRLASIIEGTNVGTWEWNVQTGETNFNEKWAEIIGYTLDELAPISIETWMKFAHPDDLVESGKALNAHFEGNGYYHFESRMKHKKGHWVWVLDRGSVISWTEDKKPLMMYGTHQDITAQKELELSLKSQNQLISSFFELSPIGLALNDFDNGQFIQANQSLLKSVGYSFDEFIQLSYFDLTPKEYYEQEMKMLESLKTTGRYGPFEKEYIHKEGHLITVLLNGVLVDDIDGNKRIWSVIEDISQLKEKEYKIQKTLENLNDSQKISNLGSWEFDLITNHLEWSDANYELFEIDKQIKGNELYEQYQKCLKTSDLEILDGLIENAINKGESYSVEQSIVTAKGNSKQILGIGRCINHNNKLILRGTAQDITKDYKRRLLNGVINELNQVVILKTNSRDLYDKILSDLLNITDGEYGFIGEVFNDEVGQPYLKTYALTNISWDAETKKFYDDHAPSGLEFRNLNTLFGYALKHKEVVISNDPLHDEKRGGLPKGHPPLNAFLGIPILFNGVLTGMIGLANKKIGYSDEDILFLEPFIANFSAVLHAQKNNKRREEAEKQLRINKEKLESVFTEMTDAVWSVNAEDFSLNFITPSVVDLYGYPISDWENDTQLWFKVVVPEDKHIIDICFKDLEEKGEFSHEYRILTNYGEVKWVKNKAKLVKEANDKKRIDGVIIDISKEKEYISKLEESKKLAEQASVAKDEFLSNISHEIRTPLNAIVGFSELLEDSNLTQEQKKQIDVISVASKNLMNILNDVLDTSKLEAGGIQLEHKTINLKQVAEDVIRMYSAKAHSDDVNLNLSFDDATPLYINGDETRISQILTNLISNALKFTEKGKVDLSIKEISREKNNTVIRFTVTDTGIGIPKSKQKEVFDRFIQAEYSTTRKYGGTGLGLSIVKALVELHKGTISLDSKIGEGTQIMIDLPFKVSSNDQEVSKEKQNEHKNKQLFTGYSFLIAEDNEFNQLLVNSILSEYGANLDFALDGLEAVEKAKNKQYDLILMDLQMPNMDGLQATKIIIQDLKIATPIIACSAHSIKSEKENCIAIGIKDYISKPYKKDVLINTILQYLNVTESIDEDIKTCLDQIKEENGYQLLNSLMPIYLKRIPSDIEEIQIGVKNKDIQKLKKIFHKLAGSLGSMNFFKGSNYARFLEEELSLNDFKSIQEKPIKIFINYLEKTIEEVQYYKIE